MEYVIIYISCLITWYLCGVLREICCCSYNGLLLKETDFQILSIYLIFWIKKDVRNPPWFIIQWDETCWWLNSSPGICCLRIQVLSSALTDARFDKICLRNHWESYDCRIAQAAAGMTLWTSIALSPDQNRLICEIRSGYSELFPVVSENA